MWLLQKQKCAWSARKTALSCLLLYSIAILIGRYISDVSINWMSWIVPILLLEAVGLTVVVSRLCNYVLKRSFEDRTSAKQCRYTFWLTFFIVFGILSMYYYAFFPGGFSPDSNYQLNQATTGTYNDWHPFIHTFLFFTLPMRIFRAEEMIVFLQLLYFSLGFAYLIMTIRRYGCPKWLCALGVLWVALVPVTGTIMMYPWKDCGLAIFSTVATVHYVHIVMTKAQWLEKKRNMLACSVFWVLTALVRHNAILYVAPIMLAALWVGWEKRKQVVSTIVLFLVLLVLVKGPFYRAYHVEKPGWRILETTGMCMVILGNVVKNCPDSLDGEVLDFLYRVAPKEVWEGVYATGSFNSVKWHSEANNGAIEEEGIWNILKYTLKAFRASETCSLQAFLRLTGMVWKLDGDMAWWNIWASADTSKTEVVLDATRQAGVLESLNSWRTLIDKSIWKYPMNYIGWVNLAIIAIPLTAVRKWRDFRKLLIGMPLLCYNFGTALLLTGLEDWRFFYMTFPVAVPMIFLVIRTVQRGEDL